MDDVDLNRDLLRNMLEDDYLIEIAEDGEKALEKLREYTDRIAAVLLDLQMPNKDGFAVIREMKKSGMLQKIPVLIVSSEHAIEVESQCLALGAADFIHKPFESSIVQNRIRNTIELFNGKNRLEQKVEEQEEALRKQDRIIQLQAEKLQEAEPFNRLMMEYRAAIMGVENRLRVLNEEFSLEYNRNPFESIKSRLKTPASIYEKMSRKGYPVTVESIRENLKDVAGVRVICSFPDDIYQLAELLVKQDNITLLGRKDYIKSLHLILNVPIFLSNEKKYMKVEVQFRTIAMDFWASLEHKLKYKKDIDNAEEIVALLKNCADSIVMLDYQMQEIRDKIESSKENKRREI